MKTIILYIALFCSLAGGLTAGIWGYASGVRHKAEIAALQRTVEQQRALIKELAGMETVGITIENHFKTTTVMGKATVTAAVENNARQVATILRGELVRNVRRDSVFVND